MRSRFPLALTKGRVAYSLIVAEVFDTRNPSPQQLSVAPSSHEDQFGLSHSIKQEPVGFDMAVPMTGPIPAQRVRPAVRGKRLLCLQEINNCFESIEVFPLFLYPSQVLFKLGCGKEGKSHQSFLRSSLNERYRFNAVG